MRIYIFQNDKTPNIIKKQEIHYAATVDYNILDNACATTTTSTRYHTQHQCNIGQYPCKTLGKFFQLAWLHSQQYDNHL